MSIFIHKVPGKRATDTRGSWFYLLVVNGKRCVLGLDRNATLELLEDSQ